MSIIVVERSCFLETSTHLRENTASCVVGAGCLEWLDERNKTLGEEFDKSQPTIMMIRTLTTAVTIASYY
jgi:hypothetical protein